MLRVGYVGAKTNNEDEPIALWCVLKRIIFYGFSNVMIEGDSKLAIGLIKLTTSPSCRIK